VHFSTRLQGQQLFASAPRVKWTSRRRFTHRFDSLHPTSSIRYIPIGPSLKQSLLERRKTAAAEAFVFASRNSTPLDAHNLLARILKPACKRVGLPSISWHSFRHTHATLLSDLGESLKTEQAQLGHARLSTTAEIYTHAVPASQRAAVEKLERAIWETKLDPNSKENRVSVVC